MTWAVPRIVHTRARAARTEDYSPGEEANRRGLYVYMSELAAHALDLDAGAPAYVDTRVSRSQPSWPNIDFARYSTAPSTGPAGRLSGQLANMRGQQRVPTHKWHE